MTEAEHRRKALEETAAWQADILPADLRLRTWLAARIFLSLLPAALNLDPVHARRMSNQEIADEAECATDRAARQALERADAFLMVLASDYNHRRAEQIVEHD